MTRFWLAGMAAALMLGLAPAATQAGYIAYDNAANVGGLQDFGGSLGLYFHVNSPIQVTALGVFDNGSTANLDGAGGGGTDVAIATTVPNGDGSANLVTPDVHFTSSTPGTQINGDSFQNITPVTLGPGDYVVIGWNTDNYNSNGGANTTSTTDDGNGLITFTGGGSWQSAGYPAYPTNGDGGPANRYDAGTFQFQSAVPEPASLTLLGLGAAGLMGLGMRRKARRTA